MNLTLGDVFRDGMVLQRERPCAIWGTAGPGAHVKVSVGPGSVCERSAATSVSGRADDDGRWRVELPAMRAGEGLTLTASDGAETITVHDVAVGEVWVAAGQSNMEFWMRYERHCASEREVCANPRIRFYDVPKVCYDGQDRDFDYSRMGRWRKATPDDLEYFSAVGYYCAKRLQHELDVPVGIIGCTWGGTTSSVWMSEASVRRTGEPWIEASRERFAGVDMDAYWARQHHNRFNDHGNPFADAYGELMLPRTPDAAEIEAFFSAMDPADAELLNDIQPQTIPGCLYEHMVKRIAPYTVCGVLWYQGESDDGLGRQELYAGMLAALLQDWRLLWNDPTMPFLIVQLPGWQSWAGIGDQGFPVIRRCQQAVTDADDHAFLCSASDAGEQWDIHPKDKTAIGERLALLALGHVYGLDVVCDAPRARVAVRDGAVITVAFDAADGLQTRGATVEALDVLVGGSSVAWEAAVSGNRLVIELAADPGDADVEIRYAQTPWYRTNLVNAAGLPAFPFALRC